MVGGPALYTGRLRHRRFLPRTHAFTYDLFMVWLDIDRIPEAMAVSRLTSVNRFNWAAFDDRDHVGDPSRSLRERVTASADEAGLTLPDGPIYLLTHLRYLGYAFNPISFYYCYDRQGALAAVMGEVHSTFGEERCSWIDARAARTASGLSHRTAKTMHVSPFSPMTVDWEFVLTDPAESLVAHMNAYHQAAPGAPAPFFDATLTLVRRPWTAATIRRALARHPFMTGKVIAAIHWEAFRLWLKGTPHYPPSSATTSGRA